MPRLPDLDKDTDLNRGLSVGLSKQAAAAAGQLAFEPPAPRDTWRDDVVQAYDAFWESSVASVVQELDVAKVQRYFDLLEIEARLYDELIIMPLTNTDDNGRISTNPLITSLARIINTSVKLANEIGASPMARFKLGLTKLDAQRALYALEQQLSGEASSLLNVARKEVAIEEEIEDAEVVEEGTTW